MYGSFTGLLLGRRNRAARVEEHRHLRPGHGGVAWHEHTSTRSHKRSGGQARPGHVGTWPVGLRRTELNYVCKLAARAVVGVWDRVRFSANTGGCTHTCTQPLPPSSSPSPPSPHTHTHTHNARSPDLVGLELVPVNGRRACQDSVVVVWVTLRHHQAYATGAGRATQTKTVGLIFLRTPWRPSQVVAQVCGCTCAATGVRVLTTPQQMSLSVCVMRDA